MNKPLKGKNKEQDTGNDFYLVEEFAEKLRVSNMTIYRYIKAGKIKALKLGKGFRIEKKEFDRLISSIKSK